MFSSLLIPLDGSAQSAVSLPVARTVARATGGSITLLRVLPHYEDEPAHAEARHALERIATELRADSLTVDTIVRVGEAADEILEQQRVQGADLIIMRTHGRAGLTRAVLGSVADPVMAGSPVPVIMLRAGGRRMNQLGSMLVPIDGSPGGALALGTAIGLAQATHASLHLLEVVVPIPTYVYDTYGMDATAFVDPAWDEEARNSAQSYIEAIAARLKSSGFAVDGEVRVAASVADTIADVADERAADLIVMSTEGLTGAARALLGSVANGVVRTARCPVLLLHREAPQDTAHP
ncbi:MAG TPA: universal stress protein [Chloroflexota bacterium]